MSRTRLSKISMTPQGTWDSATEYKRLDVVSNAGASWLAKRDNVGVTPVEGEDWQCLFPVKKFELIETIKLTEVTQTIERTQEPDGTPYNFSGVVVYHVMPLDESQTTKITNFMHKVYIKGGVDSAKEVSIFRSTHILNKWSNVLFVSFLNNCGYYTASMGTLTSNRGYLDNYPEDSASEHEIGGYITSLTMSTTLTTEIPAGTVTRIYAVRA